MKIATESFNAALPAMGLVFSMSTALMSIDLSFNAALPAMGLV